MEEEIARELGSCSEDCLYLHPSHLFCVFPFLPCVSMLSQSGLLEWVSPNIIPHVLACMQCDNHAIL